MILTIIEFGGIAIPGIRYEKKLNANRSGDFDINGGKRKVKKLKVGDIIEAKGGDKFKILKIDTAKNRVRLKCLEYGIKMEFTLDVIEKYQKEKEEPCGGK